MLPEIEQLVRANIRALSPYSSARDEMTDATLIMLDANENPYDNGVNRYPDPYQTSLKKEIANLKGVEPNQIFLGNGSDDIISHLIAVFCEPRIDSIIICPPTFGMYKVAASIADVETVSIPLDQNYHLDLQGVLDAQTDKTKILFLCSPNNPTGNTMDMGDMLKLLEGFKGIVVIDEAYIEFTSQESALSLLEQYPRLVVTQTFSKAWGMAGIRMGASYSHPDIVEFLNKVKNPYNINVLTLQKTSEALKKSAKVQKRIQDLVKARDDILPVLKEFKSIEHIYPSETNFIFVKVKEADGLYQHLLNDGIVVRNFSKYPQCESCLRISMGTKDENKKLIRSLSAYDAV